MTTELHPSDKWKAIPWRKLRKVVFRLQVRIFKAQQNGNLRLVRKLQKLLFSSKAAKLLAIRQVTQLNMGKKTAGVDGKKALEPSQRFALFEQLSKNWKRLHDLWALNHWTWKFIRKQGRYNRHQTNEVIKRAFPKIPWAINSFVKVKSDKSPFDGDMIYWAKRENANYDGVTAKLLNKQNHTCTHCQLKFYPGDMVEVHHKDGNHHNWKSKNVEALHRECHQYQSIHGEVRVRTVSSF